MTRIRVLALLGALGGAAAVAVVLVSHVGASRGDATLSNRGRPAIAIRNLRLASARITSGNVLAVRQGRVFYRLERASGDPCFGAGSADQLGTPGSVICPRGGFPRNGSPVLDFSVYEGSRHDTRELSLFRVEGFAADGVAAVEFFRPDGEVALTVPVSANVYATSSVPHGPIAGFAAVDRGGKRVWRSP
jgi:hypothetical protein